MTNEVSYTLTKARDKEVDLKEISRDLGNAMPDKPTGVWDGVPALVEETPQGTVFYYQRQNVSSTKGERSNHLLG